MRNLQCRTEVVKADLPQSSHPDQDCFHINEEGIATGYSAGTLWQRSHQGEQPEDWVWPQAEVQEFGVCARILDMNDGAVILAFAGGSLVRADNNLRTFEVVGDVASGLCDVCRSPDEDLFLLLTGQGTAILMTPDFDPLKEILIDEDALGEGDQVSVGWGKKETQFHGKVGKEAAKVKDLPKQRVSEADDGKTRVVWRDDGQYFAISYVAAAAAEIPMRKVRIFTREGNLHSTSEQLNGLEHSLAWKPSGSVLASTLRAPNKYEVAFLEKNGLRHGGFKLPFDVNEEVMVNYLAWNRDSDALMLTAKTLVDPSSEASSKSYLQIYTSSNYDWSLKQSWTFNANLLHAQWDVIHPLR